MMGLITLRVSNKISPGLDIWTTWGVENNLSKVSIERMSLVGAIISPLILTTTSESCNGGID